MPEHSFMEACADQGSDRGDVRRYIAPDNTDLG